jgi:DNA-binding HxlR family transcriptional regulator
MTPTRPDLTTTDMPAPCSAWPPDSVEIIRDILDRTGDKWSILVIVSLQNGAVRYSDLQKVIPGISQRMLTLTLKELQRDGLVARTAYAEVPPRVEYTLTSLGAGLIDTMMSLVNWAADHHTEIRDNRQFFDDQLAGRRFRG